MAHLEMPVVGFGCANSGGGRGAQDVADGVKQALDCGCAHIDCAPRYYNQPEVGATAFAPLTAQQRAETWITSKLWLTNFAEEHVKPALVVSASPAAPPPPPLRAFHPWRRGRWRSCSWTTSTCT